MKIKCFKGGLIICYKFGGGIWCVFFIYKDFFSVSMMGDGFMSIL